MAVIDSFFKNEFEFVKKVRKYPNKMSSNTYRPSLTPRYGNWREREALKQKAREEAERLRKEAAEKAKLAMNDINFPAISGQAGVKQQQGPQGEFTFAELAQEWQMKDDIHERHEQVRKDKQQREQVMMNGIYVMSRVSEQQTPQHFVINIEPEKPKSVPRLDEDGFQQVKRKSRREHRELTEAEIAAKYAHIPEEDEEDVDHNGYLMETSYRHDHR